MEAKEITYEYKEKLEQAGLEYTDLPKNSRVQKLIDKIELAEQRYLEACEEDDNEESQIQFEKIDQADRELAVEVEKYIEAKNEQERQKQAEAEEVERQKQAEAEKEKQQQNPDDSEQQDDLQPWDLRKIFPGLR